MNLKVNYTPNSSACMNMDIDLELMRSTEPALRVYTWDPPAISIGASQDQSILDVDLCSQKGIAIVSRFTGGAAVLHKDEVTYTFFWPSSCNPKYNAREMRGKFMNIFLAMFEQLGLPAHGVTNKKWQMPDSSVCFHEPGENEIIVDGKKIVGSAQSVKRSGILQHGSIILRPDEELICELIPKASSKGSIAGICEYRPDTRPEEIYEILSGLVREEFNLS